MSMKEPERERYERRLAKDMSEFKPSWRDNNEFGYCKYHGDYYGKYYDFCPLCIIENLEKQNSKIIELFKKFISYHVDTNPLGMEQQTNFLKEILKELEKLE